jgi:tetratricopeptide (TPR) repeat protein
MALLDETLALDPMSTQAYRHRAIVAGLLGEHEKAFQDHRESLKTALGAPAAVPGPLCAPGLAAEEDRLRRRIAAGAQAKALAIALFLKGDRAAAERRLDEAVARVPGDPEAFQSRAVVREAAGNRSAALADYAKAAELFSRRPDFRVTALLDAARLAESAGDLEAAQRHLSAALRDAPSAWPRLAETQQRSASLVRRLRAGRFRAETEASLARLSDSFDRKLTAVRGAAANALSAVRRSLNAVWGVAKLSAITAASLPGRSWERTKEAWIGTTVRVRGEFERWRIETWGPQAPPIPPVGPSAGPPPAARPQRTRFLEPVDGTLFPADMRSPVFRWEDADPRSKAWLLTFSFKAGGQRLEYSSGSTEWTPPRDAWEQIKAASLGSKAVLEVRGLKSVGAAPGAGSRAAVSFSTSEDPVGAPIFYRVVPNPFPEPDDYVKVKWKLGWVSAYEAPETVLRNQRRCYNCHASSNDGRVFGFEFNPLIDDKAHEDRSAYLFFRDPEERVVWRWRDSVDLNSFLRLPRKERDRHQALLSSISPDGTRVVTGGASMMGVAVGPCRDLVSYSFPTKGILAVFTPEDRSVRPLPGADDPAFVQMPGSWSADGKEIYFFRAKLTPQYEKINREGLAPALEKEQERLGWRELDRIYPIKYDVYRVPFNEGRGGKAVPVPGASGNGRSNYYPRVSPDGRWMVFTQSANGAMLLREDSDLYIVPAVGGKARKLGANGPGGDSWHTWSPNSRWLVFSSKLPGGRTELMLTHIDQEGRGSPPVLLSHLRDEDGLSANLPEFFNIGPGRFESVEPRLPDWRYRLGRLWEDW